MSVASKRYLLVSGRGAATLVQILVVVAIIHIKIMKSYLDKGAMWTVIAHGLVDVNHVQ